MGIIPFHLWDNQKELLEALINHRLVIVLKARQIGITWCVAGFGLHRALFYQGSNVIILSRGENEAREILDYCHFTHSQLPDFLKPSKGKDQASLITFPSINSKLRALPATEDAGIGFGGATLLILDENDFHPYAEQNYVEIKPMIDAGGNRQLIIVSAPNRIRMNSNFKNLWHGARAGENNFYPIFFSYDAAPYRDEKWYEERAREYPAKEMETRYPRNESEALSVTTAGRFFEIDALTDLASRVTQPLKNYEGVDTRAGIIRIFKPPVGSNRYVIYTDPSMGKEDPFHTVVLEVGSKEEAANAHGRLPADEVAVIHDSLVKHYNNANNSYEYNGYTGGVFESALKGLNTPGQAFSRATDGKIKEGHHGYWMSNPLKKQLLGNLRQGVFNRAYVMHDAETIDEFLTMIWEEGEEIPKVPDKMHDDRIDAWAGAVDLLNRIPKGSIRVTTYLRNPDGTYGQVKGS